MVTVVLCQLHDDYYRYCYYLPSVHMFPRELKIITIDYTQLRTDHQSVQSRAGKVSCNKTAL